MKKIILGALAVVLLLLAGQLFGWWGDGDDTEALALRKDLAAREQVIANMTVAMARQDSVYEDSVARLTAQRTEDEEAARVERARAATLAGRIAPALPDTLRPAFDSLVAAYEATITNKDRIISGLDSRVALLETRIETRDGVIFELRGALEVSKAEGREWERLYRKKDISIFGLRLEVTCGAQAGAYYGTKGPDLGFGGGCTVGR